MDGSGSVWVLVQREALMLLRKKKENMKKRNERDDTGCDDTKHCSISC